MSKSSVYDLRGWVNSLNSYLRGFNNHLELRCNKELSGSHPHRYEVNWTGNRDSQGRYSGLGANRMEFVSGDNPDSLCKSIESLVDSCWFKEEAKEMNNTDLVRSSYCGYKDYLSSDSMNKRIEKRKSK